MGDPDRAPSLGSEGWARRAWDEVSGKTSGRAENPCQPLTWSSLPPSLIPPPSCFSWLQMISFHKMNSMAVRTAVLQKPGPSCLVCSGHCRRTPHSSATRACPESLQVAGPSLDSAHHQYFLSTVLQQHCPITSPTGQGLFPGVLF